MYVIDKVIMYAVGKLNIQEKIYSKILVIPLEIYLVDPFLQGIYKIEINYRD